MKRGSYFVLAIKHEFVTILDDELDRMFCDVDQGQWRPGSTSLFITAQRRFAPGITGASFRYYMNRATAQGLVLRSSPDLL